MKTKVDFLFMNHWGNFVILPTVKLSINFSYPTFIFEWLVFRMDIKIYRELPDWFMNHVWSIMNFDFLKKEDE